jgi:hypothetical protein
MFAFAAVPESSRIARLRRAMTVLIAVAACLFLARPLFAQAGRPSGLPAQASARAHAQVEGELEVFFEDSDHGGLRHYLKTTDGRRLKLREGDVPDGLTHGSHVRASGTIDGDLLALDSSSSLQALSVSGTNTFGEQRAVVILVNFQDNTSAPYTPASAWTTTFDAVSNFYTESSYGQTWFTGDVFGWFTIPMGSTACDTTTIASLADQAATAAGANLSNYGRRIYAFPRIAACSWWGLGSVGGSPSRAWINGAYSLQVVAHELGHNFGNHHSHSQPCAAGTCSTVEYGDNRDIMGNIAVAHTTAYQKERLGWLNYGSSPPIQTVGTSSTYWIDGYSPAGTRPKALKVLKGVDATGGKTWYYLEARVPVGADASVAPGVLIHTGSDTVASSSYQIDLDPDTSSFDSLLDVGQTFTDAAAGLHLKTVSADATGALVEVTFDTASCTVGAPTVTITPGSTVWTRPGVAASFTFSVKNNDAVGCGASSFSLGSAVPSGWVAAFGASAITVDAGASASAALTVTPAAGATGQYAFSASASRGATSASASGSIGIASSVDMTLTIGTLAKSGYPLRATVAVGGQAQSGVAVTFTLTDPLGRSTVLSATTTTGGIASTSWKPRRNDPVGTYRVVAAASSSGLTGSASGTLAR